TNKQSTSNPREPPVEIQAVFCCCGKGKKLTENDSLLSERKEGSRIQAVVFLGKICKCFFSSIQAYKA
ncbi:hypothetical protein, partial [Mannheimia haemolytica]